MKPIDNIALSETLVSNLESISDVSQYFLEMGGSRNWSVSENSEFYIKKTRLRVTQESSVIEYQKELKNDLFNNIVDDTDDGWVKTAIPVCDEMAVYLEYCSKFLLRSEKSPRTAKILEAVSILYGLWNQLDQGEREVFAPIYLLAGVGNKASSQEAKLGLFRKRLPTILELTNIIGQSKTPFKRLLEVKQSIVVIADKFSYVRPVVGEHGLTNIFKNFEFVPQYGVDHAENSLARKNLYAGCDPILAAMFFDQEIEPYSEFAVDSLGMKKMSSVVSNKMKIGSEDLDAWIRCGLEDIETIERLVQSGTKPDPSYASLSKSWENSFFGN